MKKTILFFSCLLLAAMSYGQLNMSLISNFQYDVELSDIWGWADPETGTEYALVALNNGVSIVSLADPENPVEIERIPGQNSIWRDIKTWDNYAYVTTDQGGTTEGLLVIDLNPLPDSVTWYNWRPSFPELGGTLNTCHNLYIDEHGWAYLTGCNINSGGMLFIDVFTTPGTPVFGGAGPAIYAHDVYARDNIMYSSQINAGNLGIYDVSDKENVTLLGSQTTPFSFTHNAWLNDAGDVVFTTDERADAPIAAYDISDPSNIVELDQYRPISTIGEGVIPHNVHVWNDWLVISYYTDGGIIVDASRPENLIEVGNFDTFLGGSGGFNGAWGLYPFLPSGRVLVSDIGNGLYVLDAVYMRACFLEGTVTSADNGMVLNGVTVEIDSEQPNLAETDLSGVYRTGQVLSGTFDVTFTKPGFYPKTVSTELANGEVTILDVELESLGSVSGQTVASLDGSAVPDAEIVITNGNVFFEVQSDASGSFSLSGIEPGTYNIFAGAWGYLHGRLIGVEINNNTVTIELGQGYQDDFAFDLGWTTDSDGATTGYWNLGEPILSTYGGNISSPPADVPTDILGGAYITGNGGGDGGSNDIDGGLVRLTSPVMQLADYGDPVVSYQLFFYNGGGQGDPPPPLNDDISVYAFNGTDKELIDVVNESSSGWRPETEIHLAEFINITNNMQIIFEAQDASPGHIAEAGVDKFLVVDAAPNAVFELDSEQLEWNVYPNPFKEQIRIEYQLADDFQNANLHVYNAWGQRVATHVLRDRTGTIDLGQRLGAGLYFVQMEADGQLSASRRVVKVD